MIPATVTRERILVFEITAFSLEAVVSFPCDRTCSTASEQYRSRRIAVQRIVLLSFISIILKIKSMADINQVYA